MDVVTDTRAAAATMEQPAPLQQPPAPHYDPKTPYALVPFSFRNPFHDALRDAERRFPIADTQVRIRQGWKNDGKGGTAIGFGASVYDAAVALSLYLDSHRDAVLDKRVIELGCGPGLVGIVAGHLHARSVVVTDGDPASVALTASNIELNKLDPNQCRAEKYLWGDRDASDVLANAPYDVILGGDIIACPYASAFSTLLEAFLQLSDANTTLLLAYKLRHGSENAFFEQFETHFVVERVPDDHLHADFQQSDIVLFRARRRGA